MEKVRGKREGMAFLFWLAVSAFFLIESWRLGLGGVHAPGPGFLPFWVGMVVGILTVVEYMTRVPKVRPGREETQPLFRWDQGRKMLYVLIFIFAYPFFFDKLGFLGCTLLFTAACLRIIGSRSWFLVMGLTLLITLVAYLIFVLWLQLLFPEGRWIASLIAVGRGLLDGAH